MPKAIVTGDITLDWNLYRRRRAQHPGALWEPDFRTKNCLTCGGAVLLQEIIAAAVGDKATVPKLELTEDDKVPGRAPFWHSYSLCEQFIKENKDKGKGGIDRNAPTAWRIKEFIGLEQTITGSTCPPRNLFEHSDDGSADLVVVDNANQGFSGLRDIWPKSLSNKTPGENTWLLLKWSRPDFRNPDPLWSEIVERFKGRLIVVVTVNDLRLREMQISRALSWERTALDLFREVTTKIPGIDSCAHFVVSIYTEGALSISRPGDASQARLYYDPRFIEGTWARPYPGSMAGYTQCLVAGIAAHLLLSQEKDKKDIGPGILAGLAAARWLHQNGFNSENEHDASGENHLFTSDFSFPVARLGREINEKVTQASNSGPFREQTLNREATLNRESANAWAILKESYPDSEPQKALKLAAEICKLGDPEDQLHAPVGKFGKLLAINRTEIESLRAIRSLIEEYAKTPSQTAPLSIAVFGPPGTGKSFTIREVAASFGSDGYISDKELIFNLSQFSSPDSIYGCLHQVRDVALSEKIPLVFWDEFDSRLGETELGWLRYFLAPMQDGLFQQGPLTHNVGRAVFVFAGGTRTTMKEFETIAKEKGSQVKGTDFLSRLRGYVDVLGLDHPAGVADAGIIIRRSLLLRSILLRSASGLIQKQGSKELLNIDSGVLRAFLCVPAYKYGARSMETIARMSRLSGKFMFERSSLPAEAQLDLHVDATAFMKLVLESVL